MEEVPFSVVIVSRTRKRIVFDVENAPPKLCLALRSAIRYAVPTMRSSLCVVGSSTDTAMDYMWWTNRVSQIALESHAIDEFSYVENCDRCESGGSCCEATLTLSIRNTQETPLPVYTDDLISSDPRTKPVHRTFSVVAFFNVPGGVGVETDEPHTFSDGDLVTVLDCACTPPLPRWVRAIQCTDKGLVLERLFADQPQLELEQDISFATHTEMVGHISNRQLLYTLKAGEHVSFEGTVRKGTGRDGIKWSPIAGLCSYRPLFRDLNVDSSRMSPQQKKQLVGVCPKRVFDIEELSGRVTVARPDDCDGCRACVNWAEQANLNTPAPSVLLSSSSSSGDACFAANTQASMHAHNAVKFPHNKMFQWHRFTVETSGALDAADAVQRGLAVLKSRLVAKAQDAGAQPKEYPELRY